MSKIFKLTFFHLSDKSDDWVVGSTTTGVQLALLELPVDDNDFLLVDVRLALGLLCAVDDLYNKRNKIIDFMLLNMFVNHAK